MPDTTRYLRTVLASCGVGLLGVFVWLMAVPPGGLATRVVLAVIVGMSVLSGLVALVRGVRHRLAKAVGLIARRDLFTAVEHDGVPVMLEAGLCTFLLVLLSVLGGFAADQMNWRVGQLIAFVCVTSAVGLMFLATLGWVVFLIVRKCRR